MQYLRKELSYGVDVLHFDKHDSLLQVDYIIFDGFDQTYPNYPGKFGMYLWYLKKEVRNEVRDLTALADSNTTHNLYIQCSPTIDSFPLSLWNPYQIFSSFNISLLMFQVKLGPCKLAYSTLLFWCRVCHLLAFEVHTIENGLSMPCVKGVAMVRDKFVDHLHDSNKRRSRDCLN